MIITRRYKLDLHSEENETGQSPMAIIRDAAAEEALSIINPKDVLCVTVPVSEAVSNGLLYGGCDVSATIVRDDAGLTVQIINPDSPNGNGLDCVKEEDKPGDELRCHGRGLMIAKKLLARIGGTINLKKEGNNYVTTIKVPAVKKLKPKPAD